MLNYALYSLGRDGVRFHYFNLLLHLHTAILIYYYFTFVRSPPKIDGDQDEMKHNRNVAAYLFGTYMCYKWVEFGKYRRNVMFQQFNEQLIPKTDQFDVTLMREVLMTSNQTNC